MSVTPSCARDVVLLSAGPGDLELLTIKALKALASSWGTRVWCVVRAGPTLSRVW